MSDQTQGSSDSIELVIDEVVQGAYVSDLDTVRAAKGRIGERVDTVVSVCQEACDFEAAESLQFAIAETEGQAEHVGGEMSFERFTAAAKAVEKRLEDGDDVLVHCHAGINRSVGVLSSALAAHLDIAPGTALGKIQGERSRVNPSSTTRAWMVAYDAGLHESEESREAVDKIIEMAAPSFGRGGGGLYGYDPSGIDGSQSVEKVKRELEKKREAVGEGSGSA